MFERVDQDAPRIIRDLFDFPYQCFGNLFGNKSRSLIDIACGERLHLELKQQFEKVYFVDKDAEKFNNESIFGDITNLIEFKDKSVDLAFSFETIEHIEEQEQALEELIRITNYKIIVGSVNQDGWDYIDGIEIYKAKNKKNLFHVKEMGVEPFRELFEKLDYDASFFHSVYENEQFRMKPDLNRISGLVNYALIQLK